LLHEQSWLHAAIAVCSCTYTVCFYGVCTLAFAPTVFINTQRLPSQIDINQSTIDLLFGSTNAAATVAQLGRMSIARLVRSREDEVVVDCARSIAPEP
jgi:hypothetical protein